MTFHELRHIFATFHLGSGEKPKVIQEILGRSSIRTTMGTYSHVNAGMQEDAARRLSGLLFGSEPVTLPSNGQGGGPDDDEEQTQFPICR